MPHDHNLTMAEADYVEIYKKASLIRQTDKRFMDVIASGRIATPYYSAAGQELIPSAISVLLNQDDYIVTIYRGMHDQLAKGVPLKLLWAEIAGKVTGTCKGKGGPMHITHPASGIMVTTGIVGSGLPIANGLALASQLDGDGRVTIAYFGDGASNIGAFHEALNLASLWKLPVIFVCQNNRYGEHSAFALTTSVPRVSDRGASYSMPAETVDGNDAEAMWRAARTAIDRARSGGGPTLIEALTFRFYGHVLGDDSHYMEAGELERAMAADPVARLRTIVIERGYASAAEVDAIEAGIKQELDEAVEFALSSDYPSLDEIHTDIYGMETVA